jgi:hypothetical protein
MWQPTIPSSLITTGKLSNAFRAGNWRFISKKSTAGVLSKKKPDA